MKLYARITQSQKKAHYEHDIKEGLIGEHKIMHTRIHTLVFNMCKEKSHIISI